MARFTDLPGEILEHIGCFLSTNASITSLILVSKWFHYHFQHFVGRRIVITPTTPPNFAATLKDHAHQVFSLRFQETIPQEFYQIAFPHLFVFQQDSLSHHTKSKPMFRNLVEFFRLNPTIQDIIDHSRLLTLNKHVWDAICTSLHNPRRLTLRGEDERIDKKVFWRIAVATAWFKAWNRFEEIEYNGSLPYYAEYRAIGGPYSPEELSGSSRLKMLSRPEWPHLEDVYLERVQGSDEDLASVILCHLQPLKHMRIDHGVLGPVCFGFLRERHFDSLKTLRLGRMREFTSEMALEILQECIHLEVFETDYIALKGLRSIIDKPWACLGLTRLRVTFESDPNDPEADRTVFEQMARLKRLEELDMSRLTAINKKIDCVRSSLGPVLRLGLEAGLDQLSTLTRLTAVNVADTNQEMAMEDVEWMLEHWPYLKKLKGQLSSDAKAGTLMVRLLRDRGVACKSHLNLYSYQPEHEYEDLDVLFSRGE
ncbi:hypothetical protein BGZ97_004218 [Linnemannia gamsii]|uniref:F-box domain-containing protein n=1 Tax=Linnemannia gamsii TaxID=64522 RepID=A0A9P6QS34_9FUNG|nr:hypothetical protein BGZ97_004218 [Linnemannia gamsii]